MFICMVAAWMLCGVAATPIGIHMDMILPLDILETVIKGSLIGPLAIWIVLSEE